MPPTRLLSIGASVPPSRFTRRAWFLHLELADPVCDDSTFSRNRHGRLAETGLFAKLFDAW